MGWVIVELENTVNISESIAKELFDSQEYQGEIWYDENEVMYKNRLCFYEDHQEYMDYVHKEHIQEVLKRNKVEGVIKFGSLEGENAGDFWGYEFDGKGGMKELVGEVKWSSR